MRGDRKTTIELYCPAAGKTIQWSACDLEQKIELGRIAGAFGVEPHSLRLNGHFISRGADLVASSVTWSSLLSFFSARGFPTDPIIVHAKLYRLGTKRVHDPEVSDIGAMNQKGYDFVCLDRRLLGADCEPFNAKRQKGEDNQIMSSLKRTSVTEDQNSLKRTRTNGTNAGEDKQMNSSRKRRSLLEDQNSSKRTRTNVTTSVNFKNNVDLSYNPYGSSELSCSFSSQNMKRAREDEMLLAGPSKRLR